MVSITVDGKAVEAPQGAPLVEVLKNNGFYTSNLCYIDGLKPYAGCRTCLVRVEGAPALQLSCTALVQDGMQVTTASDEVKDARKAVLALILANHSDRCLTCHRREHCHPGDICLRDDVVTHRCLTCSKNYRCELQATCEAVGMSGYEPWVGEERSFYQAPQPPADRANPFMEFDPQMCIICTRCQRACAEKRHTSAITLSGRGWDTQIAFGAGGPIHESNCDFSGACIDVCPTAALMEHPNKWVSKPDTWTTTTCDSCAVGCSIRLGSRDGRGNIVRPGDGNPVNGDQICVRGRYGYDSLKPRERLSRHSVRRGRIQVPTAFDEAIAEAARALREAAGKGKVGVLAGATITNEEALLVSRIAAALGTSADSSLGPVMRAVKGALEARLGTWQTAGDMTRIAKSKTIILVHDDLEESHNVASVRIKDAVVRNGARLVLVGSLRSELVDFATGWLRPEAGDEGAIASALADAIASGSSSDREIQDVADHIKGSDTENLLVLCAPNPVSPVIAAGMAGGAANIAIALFGDAASEHLVVLPADVNVHGLLDQGVGATAGASESLSGLAALLTVRDDPTMRISNAAAALPNIGAIISVDNVLSEAAKAASVVLAEGRAYASEGSYTVGDFRVQKTSRAVAPEGEARDLFSVLWALGNALGVDLPSTPDAALGEIAKANGAYRDAWNLIVGEGTKMAVGASPKAQRVPVEASRTGVGLRVATARDLYTAADAAALRHPEAEKLHRYDRIQVSEEDSARLGIRDGAEIAISANGVSLRAKATVTERVREGSVFVSSMFQGGAVSALFGGASLPAVTVSAGETLSTSARAPIAAAAPVAATGPLTPERPIPGRMAAQSEGDVALITGDDIARALATIGIRWVRELLQQGANEDGRREIAARLGGLYHRQVLEWVNRADLMRVPGVTAAFADLLEDAGVDTVPELASRNAANLAEKLTEVGGANAPTPETVAAWVEAAKGLEPVITH